MTSYFRSGCSDVDEIQSTDIEEHADYGEMSRSKTKVEFQYDGHFFFQIECSNIAASFDEIWKPFIA